MDLDEKQIEEAALSLDLEARERLLAKLIRSLDGLSEEENERLWAIEAARRDAETESGEVEAIPGEEVMREVRAMLKRPRRPKRP